MYEVWADFFDDAYRALYAGLLDPVRTESEVAAVVKLLDLQEGARLLDLCCGDGRHAVPLQRRGMQVCGVDIAPEMLRAAQQRARRVLEDEAPQPSWIRADAGQLPLRASFDAAILLYNSLAFGTREMTRSLLACARAALRPGGRLLIECTHRDQEVRQERVGSEAGERWAGGGQGSVRVERRFDPLEGERRATFTLGEGAAARVKELRYRVYTAGELRALVLGAGFARVELFGGYDLRPLGLDTPAVLRAFA